MAMKPLGIDAIESLCATFTRDNSQVADPSLAIEQLLADLPPSSRPTALRNLLHIELRRLRGRGLEPNAESYQRRFPEYESLICNVFLESTYLSQATATYSRHDSATTNNEPLVSGLNHLGNYRIVREIGRGGMGAVFEAIHLRQGHRVALKTLPKVDGGSLHRFKREFRSIADLNHPNLIGYHELEADGGHWFFTMDLIDGANFLSYARPANVLNADRLRGALLQLVTGLMALHGKHIVHRDLKPSNVIVEPSGRVVILDFGLVLESADEQRSHSESFAGTPAYMAPEQATGGGISGAADWYALGVMLYQALSGQLPYRGRSAMELIHAKTNTLPLPLIPTAAGLDDLAKLAMQLLNPAADSRPHALDIARVVTLQGTTIHPQQAVSSSTLLVGRGPQSSALLDGLTTVQTTTMPLALFVQGRSGEGKSSLVDAFLQTVRQQHPRIAVLQGRCYDRESVPYKALDGLIDALASHLRRLPAVEAAALVPDDLAILARLFPVLQRVEAFASAFQERLPQLDEQQIRTRAFNALRQLLRRLSRAQPVVMFADDLQWGDADSAEVLLHVMQQPAAPAIYFIGSFRSDETDSSEFLKHWEQQRHAQQLELNCRAVQVGPLDPDECTQLTIALCGVDSELVRKRALEFARDTGGNPYLLNELIGCFDLVSDSFQALPMDEVIRLKLQRLPAGAAALLEAIAVAGQSAELYETAQAAALDDAVVSLMTHMRSEKLIRMIGSQDEPVIDTYHDKIRETTLSVLGDDRRRQLHAAFAQIIANRVGAPSDEAIDACHEGTSTNLTVGVARVYDLSYHCDAAGLKRRAAVFALMAAEQAARQFSQAVAAEQFEIARRNAPESCQTFRYRVLFGHGRALSLAGQYPDSLQSLDEALLLASGPVEQARVLGVKAEIAHKQGHVGDSVHGYSDALRRLGHWVPRGTLGYGIALLGEVAVQAWHTCMPRWTYQRRRELAEADALCIELTNRNSIVSYYHHGVRMLWTHLKGFNLAERYLPSRALAYTYGLHPAPASAAGLNRRGGRYSDIAIGMAQEYGDLLIEGHANAMRGFGAYSAAHYQEAVDCGRRGMDLLQRAGDPYINFLAEVHLALSLSRLGQLEEAWATVSGSFDRSVQLGEGASASGAIYVWSIVSDGNLPFKQLVACFRVHEGDHFSRICVIAAEGIHETHCGNLARAEALFRQAWNMACRHFIIMSHTVEILTRLVGIIGRQVELLDHGDPARKKKLASGFWYGRLASCLSMLFPNQRVRILRELAQLYAQAGKIPRAEQLLKKSLATAEAHDDQLEHARSRDALARLQQRHQLPKDPGHERAADDCNAFQARVANLNQPT